MIFIHEHLNAIVNMALQASLRVRLPPCQGEISLIPPLVLGEQRREITHPPSLNLTHSSELSSKAVISCTLLQLNDFYLLIMVSLSSGIHVI